MTGRSDMGELLTIEEVAERLRVSVLTVRWLRQEGRFAPAIKVGRRLVWDARDWYGMLATLRLGWNLSASPRRWPDGRAALCAAVRRSAVPGAREVPRPRGRYSRV